MNIKYFASILFFASISFTLSAQGEDSDDHTESINLLKTPSSPGFTLLGVEPSSIDRPSSPTQFAVSILNATNNFSSFPKNYAVEFAPAWIISGKKITYDKWSGNNVASNIWNTLSLSIATTSEEYTDTTGAKFNDGKMGIGFRFSLLQGELDKDFKDKMELVQKLTNRINTLTDTMSLKARRNDPFLMKMQEQIIKIISDPAFSPEQKEKLTKEALKMQDDRVIQINDSVTTALKLSETDKIKKILNSTMPDRYGWKWDMAGGVALDFPKSKFEHSNLYKYGFWTTFGYESKKHLSALGCIRYLGNIIPTIDTLTQYEIDHGIDAGAKLSYQTPSKLSISAEMLYRNYFNDKAGTDGWKYSVIFDYPVAKNKVLSFRIGKDYNTTTQGSGDLVATLNLLLGFGSDRKID